MRGAYALLASLILWGSGCHPSCSDDNDCLLPGQCNGGVNLQRYAIPSGHYVISQSAVGLDQCKIGRRSGDWNGLTAELESNDASDQVALRISNGVDLGSGARNPQPNCNSATLTASSAQKMNSCNYTASFSTQLVIGASGQLYLSITEQHNSLSSGCVIPGSCIMLYDATLQ